MLVVVDDFHWLDPESAAAVLFAARRLAHDPVAILLATRHGSPAGTSLDGLDTLALTGLTPSDSADLFPPGTDPNVIDRLVAATHGNPLALIEIAKRLSPAQRRGAAELADPLPTGERLQSVYEPVVSSLPPDCRRAVLLVAAASDDPIDAVFAALQAQGLDPDDVLGDAERRGVLVIEPGRRALPSPADSLRGLGDGHRPGASGGARRLGGGSARQSSAGSNVASSRGGDRTRR